MGLNAKYDDTGVISTQSPANAVDLANIRLSSAGWFHLGWFPLLSLISSIGILLVSRAFSGARIEEGWATTLYWVGLITIYAPVAMRLAVASVSRNERLALVVLTGLLLYFVKVLHSPVGLTFADEFLHWKAVDLMLDRGHLFSENSLLPVSAFYPGLHSLTSAVISIGNIDVFPSAIALLAIVRIVWIMALFLFFENVSDSHFVAGMATILYMGNPSFIYFHSQFAYESLALPFVVIALFAALRRHQITENKRFGYHVMFLLAVAAVVVTHHLSTVVIVAFLVLFAATARLLRSSGREIHTESAVFSAVIAIAWIIYVAPIVFQHLGPAIDRAVANTIQVTTGEVETRELFTSTTEQFTPTFEQLLAYASVLSIVIVLPFGWLLVARKYRANALFVALALISVVYPFALFLRLVGAGAEASFRVVPFVFIAIGFVLALTIVQLWLNRPNTLIPLWFRAGLVAFWLTIMMMGSVVTGWAAWARIPGPYLVVADMRSIEPQGIAIAKWAREYLGPENRIAADRINMRLMATYGGQRPVNNFYDRVYIVGIYYAESMDTKVLDLIRKGQLDYVVVDSRLGKGLPEQGRYIEGTEPIQFSDDPQPLSLRALGKFEYFFQVDKVTDSGDLSIYDVQDISQLR